MKKYFLLFFCLSTFFCFSQIQKEVENGIFVSFPNSPTYKTIQNASTFSSKTENSLMIVIVQRNFIPDYPNYIIAEKKWSENSRKKVADSFLITSWSILIFVSSKSAAGDGKPAFIPSAIKGISFAFSVSGIKKVSSGFSCILFRVILCCL